MIPVASDVRLRRFPVGVLSLIAANVFIFWYEMQMLSVGRSDWFLHHYGLIPKRDLSALRNLHGFPYLTSMFLHGGLLHLLTNIWALWIFGAAVEGALGALPFAGLYLLSGLAAAVFHVLLNPGSTLPVVGASGAVAGVMAAYSLLFPRSRLRMFFLFVFYPVFFELPALVFLVIWFLGQLLNALVQLPTGANGDVGGIAFAAHVGGFVAGLLLLPLFRYPKSGLLRWW